MKGVIFAGNRKVEIADFDDPTPGEGEVVLEIKASGMCGSDLHIYRSPGGGPELAAAQVGGPAGVVPIGETAGLELPDFSPPTVGGPGSALMEGFGADFGFMGDDDGGMAKRVKEGPERRLTRMVDLSEERAAKILRKWASNEKAA